MATREARLTADAWQGIERTMAEYRRVEAPLKDTRFRRIKAIAESRVAANRAEDYPELPSSDPGYQARESAFRDAMLAREEDEIVQAIGRKIVRIRPRDDPELFEVMRQYRIIWQDTAARLEAEAARR